MRCRTWHWQTVAWAAVGGSAWLIAAGLAQAQTQACGSLVTHYGPFDYRTDRARLPVVERRHFTPAVEGLMAGQENLDSQLDYTLQAFPNHHRALLALARYGQREKSAQPGRKMPYTIDCYFDRAMRFRPNDTVVRVIFAQYLNGTGRKEQAVQQLDQAAAYAGENAWSHYNIGLAYFELDQYDKALAQAQRSVKLGFERRELQDMLAAKGKWRGDSASIDVPTPASAAPAASAAD